MRDYGYSDATSELTYFGVSIGGNVIAGSDIDYKNSLQIHNATLLGLSNGKRSTQYSYDDRFRIKGSVTAMTNSTSSAAVSDPAGQTTRPTPPTAIPPRPARPPSIRPRSIS